MTENLPKVVLLNGPPRSGKDTVASAMARLDFERVSVVKFAGVLKDMVHRLFGFVAAPTDYFEKVKDEPNSHLFGKTPREVYIALSELFAKPLFGPDFFGKVLAQKLRGDQYAPWAHPVIAVSDSGFADEAQALIDWVGPKNVLLVRLHRPGTSFDGDSRSYIELPGVPTWDVRNDTEGAPHLIARAILEAL